MAKIILSVDGYVVRQIVLSKERTTIGRHLHNDIVIDNPAISAEHAVIVTIVGDSFLEDLNSTNGTQVNGQPVKKHFLHHNDMIELLNYRLEYVVSMPDDVGNFMSQSTFEPFPLLLDTQNLFALAEPSLPPQPVAVIKVLDGASLGKELFLKKALTTIGRPGMQVAVITFTSEGYCLTHVEGEAFPLVNNCAIQDNAYLLLDGDVIDLSGVKMMFSLVF
jgi:FHA domain